MFCYVKGCRFADSHSTCAHVCGKCQQSGHGVVECGHLALMDSLRGHLNDQMPKDRWCEYEICANPQTHSSVAHHCSYCHQRHHERCCQDKAKFWLVKCPICQKYNTITKFNHGATGTGTELGTSLQECVLCSEKGVNLVTFPICGHAIYCRNCIQKLDQTLEITHVIPGTLPLSAIVSQDPDGVSVPQILVDYAETQFAGHEFPIYEIIPAGMGCSWFTKKTSSVAPVEVFFLHSDNLGQYGPSYLPHLEVFLKGCRKLSSAVNN